MTQHCSSKCPLSSHCLRHIQHAPSAQASNLNTQFFEPELGQDCCGYINLLDELLDDDSTIH